MKYIKNDSLGGIQLSHEAFQWLDKNHSMSYEDVEDLIDHITIPDAVDDSMNFRCDFRLISCVEALGNKASSSVSDIVIVDVPHEPKDLTVLNYDGCETIIHKKYNW